MLQRAAAPSALRDKASGFESTPFLRVSSSDIFSTQTEALQVHKYQTDGIQTRFEQVKTAQEAICSCVCLTQTNLKLQQEAGMVLQPGGTEDPADMGKKLHKHRQRIICSNKTKHVIFSNREGEQEERKEEEVEEEEGGGELCGAATVGCLMTEMGRVRRSARHAPPRRGEEETDSEEKGEVGEMEGRKGER